MGKAGKRKTRFEIEEAMFTLPACYEELRDFYHTNQYLLIKRVNQGNSGAVLGLLKSLYSKDKAMVDKTFTVENDG